MQSIAVIEKQCNGMTSCIRDSVLMVLYHFPYEDQDMIYFPKSNQSYET